MNSMFVYNRENQDPKNKEQGVEEPEPRTSDGKKLPSDLIKHAKTVMKNATKELSLPQPERHTNAELLEFRKLYPSILLEQIALHNTLVKTPLDGTMVQDDFRTTTLLTKAQKCKNKVVAATLYCFGIIVGARYVS